METTLIADDNTASPPVSDDARNLANLPPEILQLVLRSLFQPFEIVCRCHPCLKSPHRHSHQDERYWHVLLTSHRLYTEGIPTYYSFCTLDMLHLMPLHLGTVVIKNVRNVRFHSLAILSPWRSRESERKDLCLFSGVKTIELPTLEYVDEKTKLDGRTDEDILNIESDGNGYGRWCDYKKWAREVLQLSTNPDLVVKFQKNIRFGGCGCLGGEYFCLPERVICLV